MSCATENCPFGNKGNKFVTFLVTNTKVMCTIQAPRCIYGCAGRWEAMALPGAEWYSFTCACFWGREVLQKDFKISSVRVDTGKSNLN